MGALEIKQNSAKLKKINNLNISHSIKLRKLLKIKT